MSRDLNQLDDDVQDMALALLDQCKRLGIVLVITQTYRTPEEQAALYAKGRTTEGSIVTHAPPGYSWHEFRRAFDVAIKSYPKDATPNDLYDGPWEQIMDVAERIGLECGGRWKHPDKPHFEYTGGRTLAAMRDMAKATEPPQVGTA